MFPMLVQLGIIPVPSTAMRAVLGRPRIEFSE
jgi:hypothetical protein